jgi:hypothetical protein
MKEKISEYRVQRSDIKWGSGQGHYPLAKSAGEAKLLVARSLGMTPDMFRAMRWKEYPSMNFTRQARKHLKLK